MVKSLITVAIGILFFIGCKQQEPRGPNKDSFETRIDSIFLDFDNLDSPGYAIGISMKGNTVYKRGYGAANLDYNLPIDTKSAFSIASVSKQFTAACIGLLILEEKISLESAVSEYVPELGKYRDTIRIKHLIYNTSGLTDYNRVQRENNKSWVTFNYYDIDESIRASISRDSLLFTPGEQWDYANINFMLLAKVVERVSGEQFDSFIKAHLFEPLGMENTLINDDITTIIKNRVTPYNPRNEMFLEAYAEAGFNLSEEGEYIQHPRNSPHYGGSGVVSTIDDLLKWTQNMETKEIGGAELYALMHETPKFEHGRNNQAFGLYIDSYRDMKTVAWDGGDYGISSQILRFPDNGVSIIVLSNLGSGRAAQKANSIADIMIEEGILR